MEIKELDSKIKPLVEALKREFSGVRANRPSPQLIEDIQVDWNGQMLKVKQLGLISIQPPRDILVTVWDKGSVNTVAKAIQNAPAKFNPSIEGNVIRLKLPPLTEERREEFIKLVKSSAEKSRIKLRSLRDEANKKIETEFKAKTISEDQKFKGKKQVQEAVDKVNKEIEEILNRKIKEISE
ncbi:MAG TPA: ribosome recycling factor [Candidatus Paceibacterota bacterium]